MVGYTDKSWINKYIRHVHAVKGRKKKENEVEGRERSERNEYKNNWNASRIISVICCRYCLHCWETLLFYCLKKEKRHFVVAKYKLGRNLPSDPPFNLAVDAQCLRLLYRPANDVIYMLNPSAICISSHLPGSSLLPQTVGQMFKQKINTPVELVEWSHWIPNDHARLSWMFDTVSHTCTDTWEKSGVQQSSRSAFPHKCLTKWIYVSRHNLHSDLSEALTTVHDVIKPLRSCSVPSFRLLNSGLSPQRL